jgi:hypothetical protein
MKKSASVIPIHPPRFGFAKEAVASWNQFCDGDLYFVFSDEKDASQFENFCKGKYYSLILPESQRHYRNPISVKKYYGVSELIKTHQYVAVYDAEIKVVKPFNTDEIYEKIWKTKELKCNQCFPDVNGGNTIYNNSVTLGLSENPNLIEQTEKFIWYWWFNEICIYESELSKKFFEYLNSHPNKQILLDEYWCFDYLIYGIWLICFHDFKCKKFFPDRKFGFGAIEHNQFNIGGVTETFNSYMDSNMYPEKYEKIKVQFHMDRYIPESQKHLVRVHN